MTPGLTTVIAVSALVVSVLVASRVVSVSNGSGGSTTTTTLGATYTEDTQLTNVTAISLETNTTTVPYVTEDTIYTLADGTYVGQRKTIVAEQPNDIHVSTGWGTMRLESDHSDNTHSVTLLWDGVRWKPIDGTHHSPTWHANTAVQTMVPPFRYESVCVSADGKVVFAGDEASDVIEVWLYNDDTGVYDLVQNITTTVPTPTDFGQYVSCSADGLVVAASMPTKDISNGGVITFRATQRGGTYVEGFELYASGGSTAAQQGIGLAISANGDIIAVGAPNDNTGGAQKGAMFVWEYDAGSGNYSQVGSIIQASDSAASTLFGSSLCMSSDGRTIAVGAQATGFPPTDYGIWIFTRLTGTTYTQQGNTILMSDLSGDTAFGRPSCSADASVIAVGVSNDAGAAGAAWIFRRSLTNPLQWAQYGTKITSAGSTSMGREIHVSADGASVWVNTNLGAFVRLHHDKSSDTWETTGDTVSNGYASTTNLASSISGDGRTFAYITTSVEQHLTVLH